MLKKNETLQAINSAAQLSSAQLYFKLFKILCLLINYKNYYIYFELIFDKIVYSIKCFYSYFYIQNIFGKNKNKYHCMILVVCYNINKKLKTPKTRRRSKICQKIIIANTVGKNIQMLEV